MASINQQPTALNLTGVAGQPFNILATLTITDANDDPIPWGDVSDWSVSVVNASGVVLVQGAPTVTSPSTGQLSVAWTGVQTTDIGSLGAWALQLEINSVLCTLLAGSLSFLPPESAGPSTPTSQSLTVTVGTNNVALTVNTAAGNSGGGGGIVDSVVAGTNVTVDDTDPANPIVSATGGGGGAVDSVNTQTGVVVLTAADVGADASGAASTAQSNAESFATSAVGTETTRAETAEGLLAPKASPALTGSPTAPTKTALTNNTDIATTAYTDAAVGVETTRAEAAEATFATSTALTAETSRAETAEALLAPLASPALTGSPTAPTKTALTDNTDVATTAYTDTAVGVETSRAEAAETLLAPKASPTFTGTTTAPELSVSGLSPANVQTMRFIGITASGAPASGTFLAGDVCFDQLGNMFVCITGGTPGTWVNPISTAAGESIVRANTWDQFSPAASAPNAGGNRITNGAAGALAADFVILSQASNGWVPDANVWTRTANTTFTTPGNQTSTYTPGLKVKWTESGTAKYGVVASSAFTTLTTVTLVATTDYVMAATPDSTSNNYAGRSVMPSDFPTNFSWPATSSGFSAGPTDTLSWWSIQAGLCTVSYSYLVAGTSNATTYTVAAPIESSVIAGPTANQSFGPAMVEDNGTFTAGIVLIAHSSSTIQLGKGGGAGGFTASGSKLGIFQLAYPI